MQNDCLKEFVAQYAWLVPPGPAMRIVTDKIEFCARELPRWNTVSISGYHIREAGATATQELAFTLADGIAYVKSAVDRGLDVDDFAPRLSFFFDVHNDFFEEIAKFRAARRMWARIMRDRFGARNLESMKLRTHAQTAGASLTAQQPQCNIVRVAIQALAAVLGGTQSLHTNSLDETYALPTEDAATIALRTQQILGGGERRAAHPIDPLGGSYHVEVVDRPPRSGGHGYHPAHRRDGRNGPRHRDGHPQREIAASAYRFQRQLETTERVMVGVNKYADETPQTIPLLRVDGTVQETQVARLRAVKASRDMGLVRARLDAVALAAKGEPGAEGSNLMPHIILAAKAYCTQQEICDVLRDTLGTYSDPAEF